MNKEIRETVFEARSEFKEAIRKYGALSLADYYSDISKKFIAPESGRINDLWAVLEKRIQFLPIAERALVREELLRTGFVSTAEHDGPVGNPFFLSAQLLRVRVNPVVIVFPFGSISPENSSFPRGLVVHDNQLRENKLHIISRKHRHTPILLQPAYTLEDCERVSREILQSTLSDIQKESLNNIFSSVYQAPEMLSLASYEDQLSRTNYSLFRIIPGMENTSYISVCIESLALDLIREFHLDKKTPIGDLLGDRRAQSIFKKEFNDLSKTDIFWGIREGQRVSLALVGGALVDPAGAIFLELNHQDIKKKIHEGMLIPSTPLCFMLMLYYGLTCAGGFSQIGYLPRIKQRCQSYFSKIGYQKESIALEAIAADIFLADLSFLTVSFKNKIVPATLLDLCIDRDLPATNETINTPERATLAEATDRLMPLLYKIIVGQNKISTTLSKKKSGCQYCGNNPISHLGARIESTISLTLAPVHKHFFATYLGRTLYHTAELVLRYLRDFFIFIGVVRFNPDPASAPTRRGQVLFEEALARGWKMDTVTVFGYLTDHYRVKFFDYAQGKPMYFTGLPRPEGLENTALMWIDDKAILKDHLSLAGVRVPRGGEASTWEQAEKYFRDLEKPVIVKPRLGSRGRHTTTNLNSIEDLVIAFNVARQLCRSVIIEEHLVGSVYRATLIDGALVGVLTGDPPRVIGDGIKTIHELIEDKNKFRDKRIAEVKITDGLVLFLLRQSLALSDVLDSGQEIDLSEKIGLSYGGKSREETPSVHPKLRAELERAAAVVNDPVIGFDFITTDLAADPDSIRWGIIECNAVPFINLHHDPLEGEPINAAAKMWDYIVKSRAF